MSKLKKTVFEMTVAGLDGHWDDDTTDYYYYY